mgnify:CR=1 FL=1
MILGVSEILKKISEEKDAKKRKDMLASCVKNAAVMTILKLAFDPEIKFNLPEGDPPYKPCEFLDQQGMLYNQLRKLNLFVGAGNPNIPKLKKEMLFINMLESLDPEDAKLLLSVKDKKIPYKGITKKLVTETFPGLIKEVKNEQKQKA